MTNWSSVSRIPFRFKAACSLSSYLSRVIYFLISLSPLTTLSLSVCEFIWRSRGQRRGKVNKSLWRQLFPPSVSCLLLALSLLLCFLFVYAPRMLCSSPILPPTPPPSYSTPPLISAGFPVWDPLSYHRTTSYTSPPDPLPSLQRSLLILFSHKQPGPRFENYKIRKL